MEDALLDNEGSKKYKKYWLDECQAVLGDPNKLANGRFDQYVGVYRFIDNFIADINNQIHLKLNYNDVVKTDGGVDIRAELKADYGSFMDALVKKMKTD